MPEFDVRRPRHYTDDLAAAFHGLLSAAYATGAAIGMLSPPTRADTDALLRDVLDAVPGWGCLSQVWRGDELLATGCWVQQTGVFRHNAEVRKVVVHPGARGLGLGRVVMEDLLDAARARPIELLVLSARGNNHGAMRLYASLGFREYLRLPDAVAVGDERFDEVGMYLELGRPDGIRRHGAAALGPGASPLRGPA